MPPKPLLSDEYKIRVKLRSAPEVTLNEIRNPNASDIMENQSLAHFKRPADSGYLKLGASSD